MVYAASTQTSLQPPGASLQPPEPGKSTKESDILNLACTERIKVGDNEDI